MLHFLESRRRLNTFTFSTSQQLNTKFDVYKGLVFAKGNKQLLFHVNPKFHTFLFYYMFSSQELFILFYLRNFVKNEYIIFGHSVFLGMKCFGKQYTCITIHDHSGTYISFLFFIHHIHAYKYINLHILHDKSLRLYLLI